MAGNIPVTSKPIVQSFRKGTIEKEIPSLTPVKREKEEVVAVAELTPAEPKPERRDHQTIEPFSDEQLKEAWHKFRTKKLLEEIPDSLKMVLKQEVIRNGETELEIFLSTEIERKFLAMAETELVQFLRKELRNDRISLLTTIKVAEVKHRLYTDKEKFNYLAEKQPLLLKLKERLSLDTEF